MSAALDSGEPIVVAEGPFAHVKELQRQLESGGVRSEILQPPGCNANA